MNWNRKLLGVALGAALVAGSAVSEPVFARAHVGVSVGVVGVRGGYWHHGGYWGGPYLWPGIGIGIGYYGGFYPGYYPGYYGGYGPGYYGPDGGTVPAAPQTYVQQDAGQMAPAAPAAGPAAPGVWYHCASPEGYYPYVKQCSTPWQQVAPTPPAR